jgi:hypothetical protein
MTIGSRARCRLNFERRAGKRAAGPSAGEKIVAGPPGFHFLEDREQAIRQERDARTPPTERDADEALAAGFIVGGANGVAPPM